MVNQQGIGARIDSCLNKRQTGCHTRSYGLYFRAALDLQTVGAIVFELFGLEQTMTKRQQFGALNHISAALPELWGVAMGLLKELVLALCAKFSAEH